MFILFIFQPTDMSCCRHFTEDSWALPLHCSGRSARSYVDVAPQTGSTSDYLEAPADNNHKLIRMRTCVNIYMGQVWINASGAILAKIWLLGTHLLVARLLKLFYKKKNNLFTKNLTNHFKVGQI